MLTLTLVIKMSSLYPNRYLLFGFQHTVKVIHYLTIVKTECILYFTD